MRKVDSKNQLWHREENGAIQIGFTKSFLDGLEQCWNILPSHNEQFKLKAPLLTIETNNEMYSLLSPVAGYFVNCSAKAQNFPDKLTEDDVVIELAAEAPPRRQTERDTLLERINAQARANAAAAENMRLHQDAQGRVRPRGQPLRANVVEGGGNAVFNWPAQAAVAEARRAAAPGFPDGWIVQDEAPNLDWEEE